MTDVVDVEVADRNGLEWSGAFFLKLPVRAVWQVGVCDNILACRASEVPSTEGAGEYKGEGEGVAGWP